MEPKEQYSDKDIIEKQLKTPILKSVDKAFEALESFNSNNDGYTLRELADKINVSKGTAHRILITAQKKGIVEKNPLTNKYHLGIKLFELGSIVANRMDLRREALPIMRKYAEITGETLYLTVKSGDEALCIERVEGKNYVKVLILDVGNKMPLNIGGGPKVLLAFMNDQEITTFLDKKLQESWTENSLIEPEEVWNEIKKIRKDGYSVSFEDVVTAAAAVGAPVKNATGNVVAAISIAGSSTNFIGKKREDLIELAIQAGQEISMRLGYNQNYTVR